ncbi:MAG TPA: acylphosphatase [Anaerolineae bacterium]|nr:acylphosphatase [Anaerolineae bacterium]
MSTPKRLRAILQGRVQGVFFRDFTRTEARALGLAGYVRNLPDGTVEVVAEGPGDALEKLQRQLKLGPPSARVERLDAHWEEATGEFNRFEVGY